MPYANRAFDRVAQDTAIHAKRPAMRAADMRAICPWRATPLLAVIVVLVQTVYIEDVLGDKNTEVNEKNLDEGMNPESGELVETDKS